ncbi:MAG TPA: YIP1 family protein [Thermoanaerobaculia bacterium]
MHFLKNLAAVLVRPRATMARILPDPRPKIVLLLFVLAVVSGIFGDFDAPMMQQVVHQSGGGRVALIVAGVILGLTVVLTALCWFYAWVPYLAGRFLGGTGDVGGVRAATAWGLAPAIWALLYRVPAAIWLAPSAATSVNMRGGNVTFDPGRLSQGCGVALVFAIVEFLILVWCAFVMSNTVAEAHRFSAWHALGTLVISAIAPLIVVAAAVLAMM